MKKVLSVLAVASVMMLVGCSKEHQCKCEKVDAPDDVSELNMVFVLDGAISCDKITEMAFEEHVSVEGGTTLRRVDVHKVKCRDYGD